MSNRFEHLKKKSSHNKLSREDFIDAAQQENSEPTSRPKTSGKDTVLSVSGRMSRSKSCGKPMLIYLKKDIEQDIQKYCHGNKGIIINYLLRRGLNRLIDERKLILHMEEEGVEV